MLEFLKERGAQRITGSVESIRVADTFSLEIRRPDGVMSLSAEKIVNAAGPFAERIAGMLDASLPLHNTLQQKIAFQDTERAIPRDLPFSIDLDGQGLDWTDEERQMLIENPTYRWLTEDMPGSIHCRPDGGDSGTWLKLGWAFNATPAQAQWDIPLNTNFPEIVLRGAARLNPSLKKYYGKLPRAIHHYGGWYTMTDENWPIIGPHGPEGAFTNCGLSGFGTMAACAGGELCAAWVTGSDLPDYAREFSLQRYEDEDLMTELRNMGKGVL